MTRGPRTIFGDWSIAVSGLGAIAALSSAGEEPVPASTFSAMPVLKANAVNSGANSCTCPVSLILISMCPFKTTSLYPRGVTGSEFVVY